MAKIIDPTQTGNYPVILSDRLLGKEPNEIFTGVRYNHRPNLAPDTTRARLKPSVPGQSSSYDLAFTGGEGRTEYAFAGTRTIGDGQYVLYFDQKREVFVLDRLDSTFHMNLTRTPTNSDPESLSRKYPHIDSTSSSANHSGKSKASRAASPLAPAPRKKDPPSRKPEKKAAPQPKNVNLALPKEDKTKPKPKSSRAASEDEDDDNNNDDDLLLVEYPGGNPKAQNRDFSPAFPSVRRFDDFMDQRESEADDADGESLGDPDTDFKLPSPVNNHGQDDDAASDQEEDERMDVDDSASKGEHRQEDDDMAESLSLEDDLEKDLEEAFEAAANSNNDSPVGGDGDESEISEED